MLSVLCILLVLYPFLSEAIGRNPTFDEAKILVLSGVVGIFLGDSFLFNALSKLGPRRSTMMFSSFAPLTAIFGGIFLSESLTLQQGLGVAIAFGGILLAITFGKRPDTIHDWEKVRGSLSVGLLLGFLAAVGHASGLLISRPVMEAGVDPLAASLLRAAGACVCYFLLLFLPSAKVRAQQPFGKTDIAIVATSGSLGMVAGASLYLFALMGEKVGIVATLSSLAPVMVLPILWIKFRQPPAPMAWVGALIASIGAGMIFS